LLEPEFSPPVPNNDGVGGATGCGAGATGVGATVTAFGLEAVFFLFGAAFLGAAFATFFATAFFADFFTAFLAAFLAGFLLAFLADFFTAFLADFFAAFFAGFLPPDFLVTFFFAIANLKFSAKSYVIFKHLESSILCIFLIPSFFKIYRDTIKLIFNRCW
jgi:hypothetical protein